MKLNTIDQGLEVSGMKEFVTSLIKDCCFRICISRQRKTYFPQTKASSQLTNFQKFYPFSRDNPCSSKESNYFLGTVTNKQFDINRPMIDVYVNNVKIEFRIDAGADVTVISNKTFQLYEDAELSESSQILTVPQSHNLKVAGKFNATLAVNNYSSTKNIYVQRCERSHSAFAKLACNQSFAHFC